MQKHSLKKELPLIFFLVAATGLFFYFAKTSNRQAIPTGPNPGSQVITPVSNLGSKLEKFSSDNEFDQYVEHLKDKRKKDRSEKKTGGFFDGINLATDSVNAPMAMEAAESDEAESITNTQEQGVDEGGIVKAYKNFLLVLRRGRIFVIDAVDMKKVSQVDANPAGLIGDAWYDEMLIYHDRVIVIGYRHSQNATELGMFQIDDAGQIVHSKTYFLDSNDYYSSRNYASRLIEDELIFYMPGYLFYGDEVRLPQIREYLGNNEISLGAEILAKKNIYQPVQKDDPSYLHTVIRCSLADGLKCKATAILGPYSRNFYVSANAVYVWISGAKESFAYRLDLKEDLVGAVKAQGSPVDQFSFYEKGNYLNVLVRKETSGGDAMWQPELSAGQVVLTRINLDSFHSRPEELNSSAYVALPTPRGYYFQNRFIGDYLFYGGQNNGDGLSTLYVKNIHNKNPCQKIPLKQSIERIDAMGVDAIVVGSEKNNLRMSWVDPESNQILDSYLLRGANQGESRSHGFFFKPQQDGTGILGLPVIQKNSQILFLQTSLQNKFQHLGQLKSRVNYKNQNDNCQVSCTDWYGNSRPIFYSGRIFGLMGYELVEGELKRNRLWEKGRTDFTPEQ